MALRKFITLLRLRFQYIGAPAASLNDVLVTREFDSSKK